MDTKKTLNEMVLIFENAQGKDCDEVKALKKAVASLELWDEFKEKMAEKCNAATCGNEWNAYYKAIVLVKESLGEEIK